VNKNTILAFALILLTFIGFSFYESHTKHPQASSVTNTAGNMSVNRSQEFATANTAVKSVGVGDSVKRSYLAIADTQQKAQQKADTIWVDNGKIICGISELGARIVSLKMKEYAYNRGTSQTLGSDEMVDLVARSQVGGVNLTVDADSFDAKLFSVVDTTRRIRVTNGKSISVVFNCPAALGSVVTKRYTFEENSYRIGIEVSSPSLDGKNISMGWHCGITESEYLKGNSAQNSIAYVNEQRKVHVYGGKSIEHVQIKKPEDRIDPKTGFYKWCALTSKYFVVALVADTLRSADVTIEGYDSRILDDVKAEAKKGPIVDYSVSMRRTAEGTKEAYWLYAGPGKLSLLQSYKIGLEKVLFGGWELFLRADIWFPYICEFLLWLLVYVNNLVHDYGFTIIILTLITRIITYPLSQSSMKSMNRMKLLQPKINHIRERYKSNPKKMNEEIMAMYREEGINPLNPGCLPMFLQMPILIALYVVLQKAIELRGAHTVMIPWVKDLSQPEMLVPIKNIPVISGMFPNGIPMYGYGIALLPIAMALLTFVQNKMTIKDPNQKAMIYFMPIFMLVLFNNLPAGLVFYWTVSNALGILQQYILNKSMEKEAAVYKANEEKNQRTPKKSGR